MIFTDIEYPKPYALKFVPGSKIRAGDPGFRLKSCCVHNFAPVQGLLVRISNPIPRLKSCCVHTFAPVQGLRERVSNRVPRLKSCCLHTFAPVQGFFVRTSDFVPRLKPCCVHTLVPVQSLSLRASSPVPGMKSCCVHTFGAGDLEFVPETLDFVSNRAVYTLWRRFRVCLCEPQTLYLISNRAVYTLWHRFKVCLWDPQTVYLESCCVNTFAPVQGLPRAHFSYFRVANTPLEEIMSQTLQTLLGTFWAFFVPLLGYCSGVSLVQTLSWQEFYHRNCLQTLPETFWAFFVALLGYCSQSVLGRTHSLEVLPSQTLTWRLSLDWLGYCCPERPRSHTISWRFFCRRHSPGVSPWISLGTVVQSVLGRIHFPGGSSVADTLLESLPGFAWLLLSRVSSVADTLLEVVPSHLDHRTMVSSVFGIMEQSSAKSGDHGNKCQRSVFARISATFCEHEVYDHICLSGRILYVYVVTIRA